MTQAVLNKFDADTAKRSSKRDAILDAGARLMNDEGAGGVRLGDIADQLELSRNALYYYVKDRSDLLRQCYERACRTIEMDLKAAVAIQSGPREQIAFFIERTLLPDRPQRAVLADIDILEEPYREQIQKRYNEHEAAIASILKAGQNEGVFKAFNTVLAANSLIGMMNWTLLRVYWRSENDGVARAKLRASGAAIQGIFFDGLSTVDGEEIVCEIDYSVITHKSYNVFDKSDANLLRQSQLIEAASLLFNRGGLNGTSIEAIGEAVGASKGAVYHHFQDKAELIERCYERAYVQYEMIMDRAEQSCCGPLENILSVFHLNCQAQASATPPLVLQPGLKKLPNRFLDRSDVITKKVLAALAAAAKTGKVHEYDPSLTEVLTGAFFWVQKWRKNHAELTPMQIADQMTALANSGICVAP